MSLSNMFGQRIYQVVCFQVCSLNTYPYHLCYLLEGTHCICMCDLSLEKQIDVYLLLSFPATLVTLSRSPCIPKYISSHIMP